MSGVVLDAHYMARRNAAARANAWMQAWASYNYGGTSERQDWPLRGEVERETERYISGEITLEAFEARLNIVFDISG